MTLPAPFDVNLPSPIGRLAQLRARASEAVVRDNHSSDVQRLMAPAGSLEEALWDALGSSAAPRLLVLTGSAGSGKSAIINHLLDRELETGAGLVGEHLADATHSDAPDQGQAERLATFFAPFADGVQRPGGPCRVVAMNTGLALRFFNELPRLEGTQPLAGLEALLRRRLGLPASHSGAAAWLEDDVLVVNLDHRPTAGEPGDLFDELLQRLDPTAANGVFQGAARCGTCHVQEWCWPMANASLIASGGGRAALNAAVGDIARTRGRQLPPRALWDLAADLALSGADLDGEGTWEDPCFAIAAVAARADDGALLRGLACGEALAISRQGSLADDVSSRDPGYLATRKAHELLSDAGLDPSADGQRLREWLSGDSGLHPAVDRGARLLVQGRAVVDARDTGRLLTRAAWLAGELSGRSGLPPDFERALQAQAGRVSADEPGADGEALYAALESIEEGLAEVFGLSSGPERYYPTSTPSPDSAADLLVKVALVHDGYLTTEIDPIIDGNPAGSALVGYRPLALSLVATARPAEPGEARARGRHVPVDFPLWQLLRQAAGGTAPSSVELERFLALRQAIRSVGVAAAADRQRPMPLLVRERGAGGRRFRLVSRNMGALRATEVI